jgi:CRISP-associated protein Cas1
MEDISPSDLKTILHSKRANLYYLEHCRVLVNGGRVEYVTDEGKRSLYWNIPIANTTSVLLGTGTSITQAAMRELAKAGVLVGFCGGGGTPLFSATERDTDIVWFSPQSEYRPTQYLQAWVAFWFDEAKRLAAAKRIQHARVVQIRRHWLGTGVAGGGFDPDPSTLTSLLERIDNEISSASSVTELLTQEAQLTKLLYKRAVAAVEYGDFVRVKQGKGTDAANRFLDHGNYLAYGLAASATWVLGLPHGLAVLHGKTRRGGLVFDVADLVKDAMILPQAFRSAANGDEEQEFRQACIDRLVRADALDYMIETLEQIPAELGDASR